jgi:hypothetical protein
MFIKNISEGLRLSREGLQQEVEQIERELLKSPCPE